MGRYIVTKSQLNAIKEALTIGVNAPENTRGEMSKSLSNPQTQKQISQADNLAGDVNVRVSSPETDNDMPRISVPVSAGQTPAQALDNAGAEVDNAISKGCGVDITNADGVNEGRFLGIYTKKQIMEARGKNMRRGCSTFTKREFLERCKREKARNKKINESIDEVLQELSQNGGFE